MELGIGLGIISLFKLELISRDHLPQWCRLVIASAWIANSIIEAVKIEMGRTLTPFYEAVHAMHDKFNIGQCSGLGRTVRSVTGWGVSTREDVSISGLGEVWDRQWQCTADMGQHGFPAMIRHRFKLPHWTVWSVTSVKKEDILLPVPLSAANNEGCLDPLYQQ